MSEQPKEHRAQIAEARNVLGEVIARARFGGEPTILINRGKEAAAIVSMDFYERARRDRAQLQAMRDRLDELAGQPQTGDVKNVCRVVSEALDLADRRAAENIARS
jgi:prevent-host-death family protein